MRENTRIKIRNTGRYAVIGCSLLAAFGSMIYLAQKTDERTYLSSLVERVLDTNTDGRLSEEETQPFYDRTGINPETKRFEHASIQDLKIFLGEAEKNQ